VGVASNIPCYLRGEGGRWNRCNRDSGVLLLTPTTPHIGALVIRFLLEEKHGKDIDLGEGVGMKQVQPRGATAIF